jgi:branched-chain amino acid aminotransferase
MAAGTAAALVPIRSITRRIDPSSAHSLAASDATKDHVRVSFSQDKSEETIMYITADKDEAGPICDKLLTELKAIQQGKAKDPFNWRFEVRKEDASNVTREKGAISNGDGVTVDQLD